MSDDPFPGLGLPEPPPDVRDAALRAGRAAFGAGEPQDLWVRLFRSRPARLAWAASVLLLLSVNARLLPGRGPGSRPGAGGPAADPEVASILALPAISDRALSSCTGAIR